MADDIFRRLRGDSANRNSPYSVQGNGTHPRTSSFGERPGVSRSDSGAKDRTVPRVNFERRDDGDRPPAYSPPAVQSKDNDLYEWTPPTVGDIAWDLALRVFEVGIAAAAHAIGEEISYFFRRRRLHPPSRNPRDW